MVRRCFPVKPIGYSKWSFPLAKIAGSSPVWVASFFAFSDGTLLVRILLPSFFFFVVLAGMLLLDEVQIVFINSHYVLVF